MPEIRVLKPVDLWTVWPNEAHDFTPWLANHIDRLGDVLNLRLEQVQTEVTLPRAGRVDICALQSETGATVVIENQLGGSDDSHCLRLLGYAANAEANILVWVARSFTSYHRSILKWLNEADTIDVYAVEVRAYCVGKALAVNFCPVVEPLQSQPSTSRPTRTTASTLYAEFYRPLVARLRHRGVQPVGKGGWRGRWRSFQTQDPDVVYATEFTDRRFAVFLSIGGTGHQETFRALRRHREDIDREVGEAVSWQETEEQSLVMLERNEAVSLTAPEGELEAVRQWMAENLLVLRRALQPHLDEVMRAKGAGPDEVMSAD